MSYLRAVLKNDTALEISHLKKIISLGKQLNINTSKYENELLKLTKKQQDKKTLPEIKPKKQEPKPQITSIESSKYTIEKVYTKDNMIIIDFYHQVSKNHINYEIEKTKYANYYLFNLKGSFKDAEPTKLELTNINRIYVLQKQTNLLQIKVKNKNSLKPIYIINNKRIIIKFPTIQNTTNNIVNKTTTTTSKTTSKNVPKDIALSINKYKKKIVVIDAGHGGKDAGAVGPGDKYEKTVVLSIGKYLYNILKQKGYEVYITRNNDRFIKVRNRTVLANNKNADIFLSIHANSVPKSKAHTIHGIETFFLSPARSERAKRVAAKENQSDIRTMSDATQESFLMVLNQSKITASNKLAIDVQQNMLYSLQKKYKDVVDGGVREGPFWVLVGAQMPSILIEVGYISHPKESKRLYNRYYQELLAKGIANGIDSYFLKNP
ncbi:N-acetylmuramoyl-L-alanine amidase [Malaciobacter mytili LMG 24559]|uniref:N-acetylmuramoyl-L-alanine amidase n=1 Tax=Malaciobacter mytili LMG 24559 TaxID=1032238 RepID=A0AAX2AIY5_9BACT|nr:N-acetylmuramoyl-L-alanine amidase [Malaciobacter mytili]AXH14433.1 N-acetylmuramoyl-L-alanine amidase [Malaciobacter mytili LMG 24559]RXK15993.1 N-acetylmuramoyl-L-alanine amidase [Malaciobacter mytili LMG 24559]